MKLYCNLNKKTIIITENQARLIKKNLDEYVDVYNTKSNTFSKRNLKELRLLEGYYGKADLSIINENQTLFEKVIYKINSCLNEEYGISAGSYLLGQRVMFEYFEALKNGKYEIKEKNKEYQIRDFTIKLTLPNELESFGDFFLYKREMPDKKQVDIIIHIINYNFINKKAYEKFINENGDFESWTSFQNNKFMSFGNITIVCPSIKNQPLDSLYSDVEHEILHFYQQNVMDKPYDNRMKMANVNYNMKTNKDVCIKNVSRILYLCDNAEQDAMIHGMYSYVTNTVKDSIDMEFIDRVIEEDTAFKCLNELELLIDWLKSHKNDVEHVKSELKKLYNTKSIHHLIRYAEDKLQRFYKKFARNVRKIKMDTGLMENTGQNWGRLWTHMNKYLLPEYRIKELKKLIKEDINSDVKNMFDVKEFTSGARGFILTDGTFVDLGTVLHAELEDHVKGLNLEEFISLGNIRISDQPTTCVIDLCERPTKKQKQTLHKIIGQSKNIYVSVVTKDGNATYCQFWSPEPKIIINQIDRFFNEGIKLHESYNMTTDLLTESVLLEADLKDIYPKYYNDIPENDFWQIVKADPTWNEQSPQKMGKYGKWLLNQFKQGKLKLEDLYKYKESLEAFHKFNRQLEKRDINAYGDGNQLYDAVKQFIDNPDQASSKSDGIRRIKQDAEKVYEDNEWLIVVPKTDEAAKYYGKGTRWCTAADYDNMFNYYNQDGPLYINIRKSDDEKFQFHFESEQFMDSSDTPIPGVIADEIGLSEGASEFYASLGETQNYEINEHEHDDPDAEPEEETIYENEAGWKITAYPDSENCYVIAPDGEYYYVEYSFGVEKSDGTPLNGVLSDYFPADIIPEIGQYLKDTLFYGLLLNIKPDDIKEIKHTKFVDFEKGIEEVNGVVVTFKNQNTIIYSINPSDWRGRLLKDFGQDGYIYDDNLTQKITNRYTDFRFLVVKNINNNKYNVFKQGEYIFAQDIDKISFSPNDNPSGIIGENAIITNGTPDSNMIIPPFQKGLHVTGCNYDGKRDLAIISHDINSENNSVSQLSIYSVSKQQYLTSRLYDSISILSRGDYSYGNNTTLGYLMFDKGFPNIWVTDLISVKTEHYYDAIKKMSNILNIHDIYNPDSENEVILMNGTTTTLKEFYINLGIYEQLKEIWNNNQNLVRQKK